MIKSKISKIKLITILVITVSANAFSSIASSTSCNINVTDYGASGNGITDDTVKIQEAVKSASKGSTLCFPGIGKGYLTTNTIIIPPGISVWMDAPLIFSPSSDKPALIIGDLDSNGGYEANTRVDLKLDVYRLERAWGTEQDIGIQLVNLQDSRVRINRASNFTIGVQAYGFTRGFAFNNIELGSIRDNKYGLDLVNEGGEGTAGGYVNENVFINGEFRHDTNPAVQEMDDRFGIRIRSNKLIPYYNDNNVFIKQSFELIANQNRKAIPVLMEHGNDNQFIHARSELSSSTFANVLNDSRNNVFALGYSQDNSTLDDQSKSETSTLTTSAEKTIAKTVAPIFSSGPLIKKVTKFISGGKNHYHIASTQMGATWSTDVSMSIYGAAFDIDNEVYVGFPDDKGVGVYVDTSTYKRFILRSDYTESENERILIRAYDTLGNFLTGSSPKYVKNAAWNPNSNAYSRNATRDLFFVVDNDVDKIQIGLYGFNLKSFSLVSYDGGSPKVWVGYEEGFPGAHLATTLPQNNCEPGRMVFNAEPEVGESIGWVCLINNQWNEFGTIAP